MSPPPEKVRVNQLLNDLAAVAVYVDIVTVEVDGVEMDEFRFTIDRASLDDEDES